MTNTQHTPGPWAVCPRGRLTPGATVPIHSAPDADGDRLTVANVRTIGPQGDADARLIAASPKLLAACQRALAEAVADDQDEWFADMRAAIAEATGK